MKNEKTGTLLLARALWSMIAKETSNMLACGYAMFKIREIDAELDRRGYYEVDSLEYWMDANEETK